MRLQRKSLSKVELTNLLKRKRTSLSSYLKESGIVTYDLLVKRCNSIGVVPPSEDDFKKAKGTTLYEYSSPTEGIVVLQPKQDDVKQDLLSESQTKSELEGTVSTKRKKKKE